MLPQSMVRSWGRRRVGVPTEKRCFADERRTGRYTAASLAVLRWQRRLSESSGMNANTRPDDGAAIDLAHEPDFVLGGMTVQPSSSQVVLDERARRIEPRVMQTLVALAQAKEAVVSRDELMVRCWSGMVVGEDAVTRAVGQLRRLSGAVPGAFTVETIPKIGYRLLVAPACKPDAGAARSADHTPAARASSFAASLALAAVVAIVVIAGAFAVNLSSAPLDSAEPHDLLGTQSAEARDRHARATALLSAGGRDNALRAEQLLREALALDPSFHAAKEALVIALTYAATFVPERNGEARTEASELLDAEIVESPVIWRAHVMRGFQHGFAGDWAAAERALARARVLAPAPEADELGALELFIRSSVGRLGESLELVQSQAQAHPVSLDHSRGLQQWLDRVGRHAEAEAEYVRSRDLLGERSGVELTALVRALGTAVPEKVAEQLARYVATDWGRPGDDALATVVDDRSAALSHLHRQIAGYGDGGAMPPFLAAAWASYYGDEDLAVAALRAHPESLFANPGLLWDPVFATTRRTDAFKTFLRDFGYVEYWRTHAWGDFCRPAAGEDFQCR